MRVVHDYGKDGRIVWESGHVVHADRTAQLRFLIYLQQQELESFRAVYPDDIGFLKAHRKELTDRQNKGSEELAEIDDLEEILRDLVEWYRRPWTTREVKDLENGAHLGAEAIAVALGRTVGSVRVQASRQGISLRRPDEARGALQGQRRGMTRAEAAKAGEDRILAARVLARRTTESLCPVCARTPVEDRVTGTCFRCRTEIADEERTRERGLVAERKRREREKTRSASSSLVRRV